MFSECVGEFLGAGMLKQSHTEVVAFERGLEARGGEDDKRLMFAQVRVVGRMFRTYSILLKELCFQLVHSSSSVTMCFKIHYG